MVIYLCTSKVQYKGKCSVITFYTTMEDPFENRQQQNVLQDFSIRHEDESGGKPSKSLSSSVKTALWIMKILVLVVTTTCLVFNKLTIIERFSVVYQHVNVNASFNRSQSDSPSSSTSIIQVLQVYWQLLFIVMIPNCILWLYSIFKGIFSQSWSHPWPSTSAVLFVSYLITVFDRFELMFMCIGYFHCWTGSHCRDCFVLCSVCFFSSNHRYLPDVRFIFNSRTP